MKPPTLYKCSCPFSGVRWENLFNYDELRDLISSNPKKWLENIFPCEREQKQTEIINQTLITNIHKVMI